MITQQDPDWHKLADAIHILLEVKEDVSGLHEMREDDQRLKQYLDIAMKSILEVIPDFLEVYPAVK